MEYLVELPQEAIVMGFAASCIEHVARRLHVPYRTVYDSLKRTDAITKYIIPHYNSLHTQSREYVTEDIIEYLRNRGEKL
ncbi:MAG: DUF3791 domain-containing protein [Marinilabiliaceae bacterium]|nr:DUF3791 domain-containing protein [Marinilabiliaceae bacterium]